MPVTTASAPTGDTPGDPPGPAARARHRPAPLQHWTLAEVAEACRREASAFAGGESGDGAYGMELFRRAVAGEDHRAWEAVVAQFSELVAAWQRPRLPAAAGHDRTDLVMRAFERFWLANPPQRFASFPTLAAVLRYLKMCAYCVLLDDTRAARAAPDPLPVDRLTSPGAEAEAVRRLAAGELWGEITPHLRSPGERAIIYGSFVLGMKPAQVQRRFPALFPSVADVYRTKREVLARLGRSASLDALRP